jgi:hypothetical protein
MAVNEGSDSEFASMMYGVSGELVLDPRIDRAFAILREPDDPKPKNAVVSLVSTGKSDEERAAELKARLRAAAQEVCDVMTAARRANILLSWEMGWDAAGRAFVSQVNSMKPL